MAIHNLASTLEKFSESVANFHVGAVSIDDFKPLDQQIADIRRLLKKQKAHWLLVSAKLNMNSITEKPQEDISRTVSLLHNEIGNLYSTNTAIRLCLQSCTMNDMINKKEITPTLKKQLRRYMRRMFVMNDNLIFLHNSMLNMLTSEIDLQIEWRKALFEYRTFLQQQEVIRDERLQETNPLILKNKKKLEKKLVKINLMKRLITNIIAAAGEIAGKNPFLIAMMQKHREVINIETITEMARRSTSLTQE